MAMLHGFVAYELVRLEQIEREMRRRHRPVPVTRRRTASKTR
jgi:hypothetical protein